MRMRIAKLASAPGRIFTTRRRPGVGRRGFTLVELMVAMALSLFLMTILAEAFAVSMDTFRGLRAIGDMQDTLRNGMRQMRDDLAANHFEGSRKFSDPGFWAEPRREGFFYMKGSAPFSEGLDGNNVASSRATDHILHFAVRRAGIRPTSFFTVGPFSAPPYNGSVGNRYVPANYPLESYYGNSRLVAGMGIQQGAFLSSQWAEVAYVMKLMPGSPATPETASNANPIRLYNLYRAEVLLLPYRDTAPIANLGNTTSLDSGQSGSVYQPRISNNILSFLSPNDVAFSTSRGFNPQSVNPNPNQISLLATNVISFQVRLLVQQRTIGLNALDPNAAKDPIKSVVALDDMRNYIFATNPNDPAIDSAAVSPPTWATPNAGALPLRIVGVQIRLRIYDPASGLSRQNTLVQAL